jgi:hypothetical protein
MTFEDLDRELPNGFHDARLRRIEIDYAERTATLDVSFWVGDIDGPNREEYRDGVLRVRDLCYYSIEPPDPAYPFLRHKSAVDVAGYPEDPEKFPALNGLLPVLPKDITCYRFFVHDWNSFIHIAAEDVQLSWAGDKVPTGLRASAS